MNRYDLSRKQFLSLGVLGGLGLLGACTLEDNVPKSGSGGSAGDGSTSTSTSGSAGTGGSATTTSSTTTGSGGSGGSAGSSTGGGAAGNGGASSTGGSAGSGGSGGASGAAGKGGTGGTGGSKDAGALDAGACSANAVAAISMNHNEPTSGPHRLLIPISAIAAGAEGVFQTDSVPGSVGQSHSHFVKLTAAEFTALRAGMTVTKRSCDSHEHQYALRCGTMPTVPSGKACTSADFCGTESNPC